MHSPLPLVRRITPSSALVAVCLFGAFLYTFRDSDLPMESSRELANPLDARTVLNGPPTESFRDALLPNERYITSWGGSAGWSNDVISFINLIYLGQQTNRIAVLPHHTSTHLPWKAQDKLPFGEAFDVPRLAKALGRPVVEWRDIKQYNTTKSDKIGCWDVWTPASGESSERDSTVYPRLHLDISYTPAPNHVRMFPNQPGDYHVSFSALMTLAWPSPRAKALKSVKPRHSIHEQLLCFDFLYYAAAHNAFEIGLQYSPAWNTVGRYMYWNPKLENLVDDFLRVMFGLARGARIPPFISIHARHSDFEAFCDENAPDQCFTSVEMYQQKIDELKAEIFERKGITVEHVVMTSDEPRHGGIMLQRRDGMFPDHENMQTAELYGDWYPSRGQGFIGTWGSTMSILASRRVQDWHDGVTRMIRINNGQS
ncbi:hypothetical protein C8F01DRAFT_1106888 [Mycena amicta]|nr:hypothetical protein C8F01DRAFT_1106888 [Mycena amicta]